MGGKYHNIKTWFGGMLFDSKLELRRYFFLNNWATAGIIEGLERQVSFTLKGETDCKEHDEYFEKKVYIADFCYFRNGRYIIEDVKSALSSKDPKFMGKKERLKTLGYQVSEVFSRGIPFLEMPAAMQKRQRSVHKKC